MAYKHRFLFFVLLVCILFTSCRTVPAEDDISKMSKYQSCGTGKIHIEFPEIWNDKWDFEVPDYNVVQLYHAESYEKWGGGHLCTFARFTDDKYKECPSYVILKETDEAVYVIIYPTDVQFDPEDEQSTKEYLEMYNSIDEVIERVRFIN